MNESQRLRTAIRRAITEARSNNQHKSLKEHFSELFEADEEETSDTETTPQSAEDAEPENVSEIQQKVSDSIDNQIDDFFVKSETEASESNDVKQEGLRYRGLGFLFEADDEEQTDTSAPETTTDEPEAEPEPETKVKTADEFNTDKFATSIMRLIENYATLIEFNDAIYNRSLKFLKKNFDQNVVNEYVETMKNKGYSPTKKDSSETDAVVPNAIGAHSNASGGIM